MGPTGHTGLGLVRVGAKYIQHREVFNTHRIMGQGEGRDFTLAFPQACRGRTLPTALPQWQPRLQRLLKG